MTHNRKRLQVYLDDAEYKQLKEWSQDTGKSMSQLARMAILEYTDYDKLSRIEDELEDQRELLEQIASGVDSHTHKHDTSMKASETVEKTRSIVERLQQSYDESLKGADLDRAIKDIAGGDPRTVKKYRQELKERGHCFEHPNQENPVWYLDKREWLKSVKHYANQTVDYDGTIKKILEPYPFRKRDVNSLLTEIKQQK